MTKSCQAPIRAMKSGEAEEHSWRHKGLADGEIMGPFRRLGDGQGAGRRRIGQKACMWRRSPGSGPRRAWTLRLGPGKTAESLMRVGLSCHLGVVNDHKLNP